MPVAPTYPGVYIEEVPSGVRTITGVATSVTAFIGYFSRGALGEPKRLFNPGDFERELGGLRRDSEAAYAIDQFFLNGGTEAWVVRTAEAAHLPATSTATLPDAAAAPALQVDAASPGAWGDNLYVDIDHGTATPDVTFNLTVREIVNGAVVASETHRNLSMVDGVVNDAALVIEGASRLIRVTKLSANLPAPSGTVSKKMLAADLAAVDETQNMTADLTGPHGVAPLGTKPTSMSGLAAALQKIIRDADPLGSLAKVTATVAGSLATGSFIHVRAGTDDPADVVNLTTGLATAGADRLEFEGHANDQRYQLGGGDDGNPPGAQDLKDAITSLDTVELFNILSIPDTTRLPSDEAASVAADAVAYCEKRRAFYILDVPHPPGNPIDTVEEMEGWIDANGALRSKNAATYFPRPRVADPLDDFRLRSIPPSGTMAGLYARIDASRGVWKAPAGIEANLRGVQQLELTLTDDQNGVLNPIGVNCLRSFRLPGNISWGGRTLVGADELASEWKYIPVRRLALFIEESLFRGTKWVVFEPNDEPLWAQIRLNVGAFMQGLFRQGAFQGSKPRDAYLVKCDKETTTQDDINRGIVNIVVGFAPLKPAEFVIIKIQQLAGQVQA